MSGGPAPPAPDKARPERIPAATSIAAPRATRVFRALYGVLIAPIVILILAVNVRLHTAEVAGKFSAGVREDVLRQLAFLRRAIDGGAAETMQRLFPEGYVFVHALCGLTWINVGVAAGASDSGLRRRALDQARFALARIESPAGRAPFDPALSPPRGAFYSSWSNVVRAGILLLAPDARAAPEADAFERTCEEMAQAIFDGPSPFPASYPGRSWPADSPPGVLALRVHDALFEPRYEATIARWLAAVSECLDPATGLIPHASRVDGDACAGRVGARGSSQALMLRFLAEIEPEFGAEQYRRFRELFVTTRAGIPVVLEYPIGVSGPGDVDSGPLVLGASLPGSAVAIGTSRLFGDTELAGALGRSAEAVGLPITVWGAKRYVLGLVPIGDAFLAWARSATPWMQSAATGKYERVTPRGWRLRLHAASIVLLVLMLAPLRLEVHTRPGPKG